MFLLTVQKDCYKGSERWHAACPSERHVGIGPRLQHRSAAGHAIRTTDGERRQPLSQLVAWSQALVTSLGEGGEVRSEGARHGAEQQKCLAWFYPSSHCRVDVLCTEFRV